MVSRWEYHHQRSFPSAVVRRCSPVGLDFVAADLWLLVHILVTSRPHGLGPVLYADGLHER